MSNYRTIVEEHNTALLDHLAGVVSKGTSLKSQLQLIARDEIDPRRFRGKEREQLIGVTTSNFYKAEAAGKFTPEERDDRNHRRGSTLAEILQMQTVFDNRPGRMGDDPAVVVSVTNFKGGSSKSTTCFYAGSYFANLGMRVLLVDLDPQASLTLNCGLLPDIDIDRSDSMATLIAPDPEEDPVDPFSIIRDTHLPSMKIIPSTLGLADIEMLLAAEMMESAWRGDRATSARMFTRVRDVLDQVKDDFDLIFLDGTPSLGILPLNIIFSSDIVLVPVPTEITDFFSTITFCELYASQANMIRKTLNDDIVLPEMTYLAARYAPSESRATSGSQEVLEYIRAVFGDRTMENVVMRHDSVISNLGLIRRTVFDVNAGEAGVRTDSRKKAMQNFTNVFEELYAKHILPRWPTRQANGK